MCPVLISHYNTCNIIILPHEVKELLTIRVLVLPICDMDKLIKEFKITPILTHYAQCSTNVVTQTNLLFKFTVFMFEYIYKYKHMQLYIYIRAIMETLKLKFIVYIRLKHCSDI